MSVYAGFLFVLNHVMYAVYAVVSSVLTLIHPDLMLIAPVVCSAVVAALLAPPVAVAVTRFLRWRRRRVLFVEVAQAQAEKDGVPKSRIDGTSRGGVVRGFVRATFHALGSGALVLGWFAMAPFRFIGQAIGRRAARIRGGGGELAAAERKGAAASAAGTNTAAPTAAPTASVVSLKVRQQGTEVWRRVVVASPTSEGSWRRFCESVVKKFADLPLPLTGAANSGGQRCVVSLVQWPDSILVADDLDVGELVNGATLEVRFGLE